jgi:hypothetical protein
MSDTWSHTRSSIRRLKEALQEADENTRWDLGFWAAGLAMMAAAIIVQFGTWGFLFCGGFVIWVSANHALTRS